MTVHDSIAEITERASSTLDNARALVYVDHQDDAQVPVALLAIAEQLALANALKVVEIAQRQEAAAGELVACKACDGSGVWRKNYPTDARSNTVCPACHGVGIQRI